MEIGIKAIGGYEEVGKNMTAVRAGDEVVILDMGLNLDRVQIHGETRTETMESLDLIEMGAIPDDTVMGDLDGEVKAIVCSHGHLDHIGAVPKLAHRYDAPIMATPFAMELIKDKISWEKRFKVENELQTVEPGKRYQVSDDLVVEFVHTKHSIPQTTTVVIHTPEGAIVYALDFRFDRNPVMEDPPDFKRLRQIGRVGVICAVIECVNVETEGMSPSESVARMMVNQTLHEAENEDVGVMVTTFSSHVARIKSIVEAAEAMDRRPLLFGRSMDKYITTAEKLGIVDLPGDIGIYGHPKAREDIMRKVMKDGKENYLLIVTGHQGEPGATLTRIANETLPYEAEPEDQVVFSARRIPNPLTIANRYSMETKLRMKGARLFQDVHVSGHAGKQDLYDMIKMLQPQHLFPAHAPLDMMSGFVDLTESMGYRMGEDVHLMRNGQEMVIS